MPKLVRFEQSKTPLRRMKVWTFFLQPVYDFENKKKTQ